MRAGQLGIEFALSADRLQNRIPALGQLAQVGQPGLQIAQLGVVEGTGQLLAVARDERHGGTAVQKLDGCPDLAVPYP